MLRLQKLSQSQTFRFEMEYLHMQISRAHCRVSSGWAALPPPHVADGLRAKRTLEPLFPTRRQSRHCQGLPQCFVQVTSPPRANRKYFWPIESMALDLVQNSVWPLMPFSNWLQSTLLAPSFPTHNAGAFIPWRTHFLSNLCTFT